MTLSIAMIPAIAANGFMLLAQLNPPIDVGVSHDEYVTSTIVGQAIILITTIAGFIYTIYRENRNRRWDLEDRERARLELAHKVERAQVDVAEKVATAQVEIAARDVERQAMIIQKIDENTKISENAFKEANDINHKIAALSKLYDAVAARTTNLEGST